MDHRRRQLLLATGALAACGQPRDRDILIHDVSQIEAFKVAYVVRPTSSAEIAARLREWRGPVSIGGGRFSMGGQIACADSLHLDMRGMHQLLALDVAQKTARVQAGMTWRQLIEQLDPHGLSVSIMQSYANFTVGGSISVNCHGRYVGGGAIAGSVRSLTLVTADGHSRNVSREHEAEIFAAAIGGYGGVGVVAEVELQLADNTPMRRDLALVSLADYPDWFRDNVLGDANVAMHNADLIPPDFDQPLAISWLRTKETPTIKDRLIASDIDYSDEQNKIFAASELPGGSWLRQRIQARELAAPAPIVWRNYEASLDTRSLEPRTRAMSTYLLQEYFVPMDQFRGFVLGMQQILKRARANVLNVSIRHAAGDNLSLLRWANSDVFCFVLYLKQRNTLAADQATAVWTRELIDLALLSGGRYYLPYRLHATIPQFHAAYPAHRQFAKLKTQLDPGRRFRNRMWDRYLSHRA